MRRPPACGCSSPDPRRCWPKLIANSRERTGHRIIERYGMTETLMNSSNPYDGRECRDPWARRCRGCRCIAGVRKGRRRGASAASRSRDPTCLRAIGATPEKTRGEFTADGWFKTGDVGRIDGDGYVYIVGRAKDLVISGGYNVYPKEVETELDALTGVLESAVFGVPHPDFGEGVTAAVVREPGAAMCGSRHHPRRQEPVGGIQDSQANPLS